MDFSFLDQKIYPSFYFENQYEGLIAGVDEVGCGPWAGPIVAAAAILYPHYLDPEFLFLINDSKKVSPKKRSYIVDYFKAENAKTTNKGISYAIGLATVEEIDQFSMGNATKLAIKRAVDSLHPIPQLILMDGIRHPDFSIPYVLIKKGDTLSLSIAAASLIAKVFRDKIMTCLHTEYPLYRWNKNAGYGTKYHYEALKKYGPTPYHRKSFAPIKTFLSSF